jgi:hypothetical protein
MPRARLPAHPEKAGTLHSAYTGFIQRQRPLASLEYWGDPVTQAGSTTPRATRAHALAIPAWSVHSVSLSLMHP